MASSHNSNQGIRPTDTPPVPADTSTTPSVNSGSTTKKVDPAWEYAYTKPEHPTAIFCKLCDKRLSGGVFRLKQHLTGMKLTPKGGRNNAGSICRNVNPTIIKALVDYQNEVYKKKQEKERLERVVNEEFLVDSGEEEEVEELTTGGGGARGQEPAQKRAKGVKGPLDMMFPPKTGSGKMVQTTMDREIKMKLRDKAAYHFAQWMYDAGIPFNAVRYPSFKRILECTGHAGPDMKPPTYHEVRVSLLQKRYLEMKSFVESFKVHWETYGCSIMSDGWTDGKGRTLINFLVNCSKGTVFLSSVDASDYVKDAPLIASLLSKIVDDVGPKNVVQVITDNASNFKAAGDLLMDMYPTLYWSPCTAHCVDLILEDIGKMSKFTRIVKESQKLVSFIYNRSRVLKLMRKCTNNRELLRPAITRFGTNYLSLESIYNQKANLRTMFVSDAWSQISWSRKPEGKRMAKIVARGSYWSDINFCLRVLEPLVDVVRLVDAEEKPAMGYIYHAMTVAKERIQSNLGNDPRQYMPFLNIVDARWSSQLLQDLHAAGFYLNPEMYFKQGFDAMEANTHVKTRLFNTVARLCAGDASLEDKIIDQLVAFREARGMMGSALAIRKRTTLAPGIVRLFESYYF